MRAAGQHGDRRSATIGMLDDDAVGLDESAGRQYRVSATLRVFSSA